RRCLQTADEWAKTRAKGKLPKGKSDDPRVLEIAFAALQARLREYPTTLEVSILCHSLYSSSLI
ncbi:hypothetical protein, partial [Aetokthonos hydrillicola]|uniref:hypothetical protein n=1 Tax=Aetokthonos hydrillicola TaxID=1550245 RepID=UPI001ABB2750